jgi:hypothetical protein
MDEIDLRIEHAAASASPNESLHALAEDLRDGGMGQDELLSRYDRPLQQHRSDPDETIWDAIADVMDFISGYCSPHMRLFPDSP